MHSGPSRERRGGVTDVGERRIGRRIGRKKGSKKDEEMAGKRGERTREDMKRG